MDSSASSDNESLASNEAPEADSDEEIMEELLLEENERKEDAAVAVGEAQPAIEAGQAQDAVPPLPWAEFPRDLDHPTRPAPVKAMHWGPKLRLKSFRSEALRPIDLFKALFRRTLVESLVTFSNESGHQRLGSKWAPLTVKEFWRWLALTILMGIHKLPSTRDPWSTTRWGKWCMSVSCID